MNEDFDRDLRALAAADLVTEHAPQRVRVASPVAAFHSSLRLDLAERLASA